jgi:hypothetical protein
LCLLAVLADVRPEAPWVLTAVWMAGTWLDPAVALLLLAAAVATALALRTGRRGAACPPRWP